MQQVICVPGNGGTAKLERCRNLPLSIDDFEGMARFALVNNVAMIVVGPEVPLAQGITDYLRGQDLKVFGPTKAGAQIESSKAWAKTLMEEAGIPTARSQVFTDAASAKEYVQAKGVPLVVKADGHAGSSLQSNPSMLQRAVWGSGQSSFD
jgi:phosphoribosylamine---glycine ligase